MCSTHACYILLYLFCQSTCGSMPRCLKQLVLVHMSFPDILPPFASAGCVVAKGFLGTWHWVWARKKPKSPKSARRQRLRIPRNEYLLFWGYGVTYVAFGGFGAHVILYLPGDRLPLLPSFCAFKGRNLPGKRCNYA